MGTAYQPFLEIVPRAFPGSEWVLVRDGDPYVYAMSREHYSVRRYRRPRQKLFVGPGEKVVLIHVSGMAAFVWRRFRDASGQQGVCNSLFINRGAGLSSDLIRQAEAVAWWRWPGERLYTYVDPRRVRSTKPGYAYLAAGWHKAGYTKGGLLVLEKWPIDVDGGCGQGA